MCRDEPNYSALENMISKDVGIAASLLKMARSSYFGNASGNIRTIKDALQTLGLNIVATAIAGLSLKRAFADEPNLESFWEESACVAQISAWLVSQKIVPGNIIRQDEVYTFCLFRDIGIPVLLANFRGYIETLDSAKPSEKIPLTLMEDQEYGINHAIIGAELAKEWNLPMEYRKAIEFHHEKSVIQGLGEVPIPDVSRYFVAISQLAEFFHRRVDNRSIPSEWEYIGVASLELLQLSADRVSVLYEQMKFLKLV
jgi:HD-like signal output (HDOD) protein